jgi:hypothetical protein
LIGKQHNSIQIKTANTIEGCDELFGARKAALIAGD